MVDFGAYPAGMSTADLIHVGELVDPYDKFYEDYEPTDEQLSDWLAEDGELALRAIREKWSEYDLQESWKSDDYNIATIEAEFESENS